MEKLRSDVSLFPPRYHWEVSIKQLKNKSTSTSELEVISENKNFLPRPSEENLITVLPMFYRLKICFVGGSFVTKKLSGGFHEVLTLFNPLTPKVKP